jgi:hypothetical protein
MTQRRSTGGSSTATVNQDVLAGVACSLDEQAWMFRAHQAGS